MSLLTRFLPTLHSKALSTVGAEPSWVSGWTGGHKASGTLLTIPAGRTLLTVEAQGGSRIDIRMTEQGKSAVVFTTPTGTFHQHQRVLEWPQGGTVTIVVFGNTGNIPVYVTTQQLA